MLNAASGASQYIDALRAPPSGSSEAISKPKSIPCKAIRGIVDEGDAILEEFANTDAADAAVIFVAQAIEHYEINRFGALYEWARELGGLDAARLLSGVLARMRVVA